MSLKNRKDSGNFILKGEIVPLREGQPRFGKIFLDILDKYHDLSIMIDADKEEEITYGEIRDSSVRLALWLRKQGIGKGDVVSLIPDLRLEIPTLFLAALYEGIIFTAYMPNITLDMLRHKLKITRPKAIFSVIGGLHTLMEACKLENENPIIIALDNYPGIISLNEALSSITQADIQTYQPVIIDDLEKTVSTVFFTSGSTGLPKGAALSCLSILNNLIRKYPSTFPNQKGRPTLLSYFPPTFTVWYLSFLTAMYEGGVYVLHRQFNPIQTTYIIDKYHINWFFIMPHEIAQFVKSGILDDKTTDLSSVEEFFTSSSVINPAIYDNFKRRVEKHAIVRNAYAMTETNYGLLRMTDYKSRANTTADPIGFVEPNVQMKVVDSDTGKTVDPYENGELFIKLPHMFLGYYNNIEETEKALDKEGWFHSGDLVYYDEKGELFFIERLKDLIKYKDLYVSGLFIEQQLLKHPDVLEACVVPVSDIYDGEHPMAFVVKRQGSEITADNLVKFSSTFGDYNILRGGVVFLNAFPRLSNKKIAKLELKQMAKNYGLHKSE